jgi:hypothetical protein
MMSTLTILAQIEMFDESVRTPDEISDGVLTGRRADNRPLVLANVHRCQRRLKIDPFSTVEN